MKCIYVALNQMPTPGVDSLMGTKHLRAEPELDCLLKEVFEHRSATAAGCSSSDDQVPFKPAAGQCRTSGMCTRSFKKEKKSAWTTKGGRKGRGGSPSFSFCTLHREVIGLSRADSGTSFCEFHTKEQIMDAGREGEQDWDSGIFSWHDTWYTKRT